MKLNKLSVIFALVILMLFINGSALAVPFAYITNNGSNTVSVIDTSTNTVIKTITGFSQPYGVAINPAGTRAYITNDIDYNGFVSVVNTSTNTVITTVEVGGNPKGIAVSPNGKFVYVANYGDGTVSIIDTSDNYSVTSVDLGSDVGAAPYGIAVNATGTRVYVTNSAADYVSVIDTSNKQVENKVTVGASPYSIAFNSALAKVYVTNIGSDSVSIIDTTNSSSVASVDVGSSPFGIAVNRAGTKVYVTNSADGTVSIIDTSDNTVLDTIDVGLSAYGIAINSAGGKEYLYVVDNVENAVLVIDTDTNSIVGTSITVGTNPISFGMFVGKDTVAPEIVSTSPVKNASGVFLDAVITVTFSEPVDTTTVTSSTFSVKDSSSTTVSGKISHDDTATVFSFTPSANLNINSTYTVTIGTGIKDIAGNSLVNSSGNTFSFTTGTGTSTQGGIQCFVATAAYGSYLDPHVKSLREFRDRYLLTNAAGRIFVRLYYEYSPPVAGLIARHDTLRFATRSVLTPIVYTIEYPFGAAAMAAGIILVRRKTRRGGKHV